MEPVTEAATLEDLPPEECLGLLRAHEVGRLAVGVPGEAPLVLPVNYVVDGETVVFRSGPGSKLRAMRGTPVSFQLDQIDPVHHTGWSVLLRGRAYETTRWETGHLDVEPWVPEGRDHWIRVVPDDISGRRIRAPERFVDLGGYL
ncbi:MAG: pyridoxamine 5'-phosphate oxidase family protein [Actinomycetota bacterium]